MIMLHLAFVLLMVNTVRSECTSTKFDCKEGVNADCVQVQCFLDGKGIPTMRVLLPPKFQAHRPVLGTCSAADLSFTPLSPPKSEFKDFLYQDIQADRCGMLFYAMQKNLEYTNVLNLYQESDEGLVVRDEIEWRIKCTYPRNKVKTVSLESAKRGSNVTSFGTIPMELEIFNPGFTLVLEKPPVFGLTERVHVQASMAAYNELELFPLNCWTTPESDSANVIRKDLIIDGCSKERSLKTHIRAASVQTRFSFEAFRFHGDCKVYIHCELLICKAGDQTSRCSAGCINNARSKRSVQAGSFISTQVVGSGPLIVADARMPSISKEAGFEVLASEDRKSRLQNLGKRLQNFMRQIRTGRRGGRRQWNNL